MSIETATPVDSGTEPLPLLVPIYTKSPNRLDAVTLLSLSERTIQRLVATGELESVVEGRRRLVVVESIRDYIERRRSRRTARAS